MAGMTFLEKRALLVTAVATGNDLARTSPFLHASRSLKRVLMLWSERRHLYGNFVVRWPRKIADVEMADFEAIASRQRWFPKTTQTVPCWQIVSGDVATTLRKTAKSCTSADHAWKV
jgi:hypothetical protein